LTSQQFADCKTFASERILFIFLTHSRKLLFTAILPIGLLNISQTSWAQDPALASKRTTSNALSAAAPSFEQALESAWLLDAASRTVRAKQAEISAKQQAASAWFVGSPSLNIAHRTDRLNKNSGLREYEAEIELPLWDRRTKGATQQQYIIEEQGISSNAQLAKLKLAGSLRNLMADYALAELEYDLALRKLTESKQLASDIERRLRAGDVAKLDALQAQSGIMLAQGQSTLALASKQRLLAQWKSATNFDQFVPQTAAVKVLVNSNDTRLPQNHPALLAGRAQLALAEAKLTLAEVDKRDPMELALGVTRERAAFGSAAESNIRVALRIPLGNDNRNMPRITAARTEVAQAQAELDMAERQLTLEIATAVSALQSSQALYKTAQERAQIAAQSQSLITRAYSLGERDLQARLRADSERYEADLAALRALAEQSRAAAQLQQALGLLP
jgi:outer membrane protein, heavy metal efflux system